MSTAFYAHHRGCVYPSLLVDGMCCVSSRYWRSAGCQTRCSSSGGLSSLNHFPKALPRTTEALLETVEVLVMLAHELEDEIERMGPIDRRAHERRVASLTGQPPPLPDFSAFHRCFRGDPDGTTPEGDLRRAFFLAYDDRRCEYVTAQQAWEQVRNGREVVSATFVIPNPPGFPILVPGQVISRDILAFMQALDTREIHGYLSNIGYRIFTEEALTSGSGATPPRVTRAPDA